MFCLILSIILMLLICYIYLTNKSKKVFVIVIGDIGRSPRMQNHSLSLADLGYKIVLIGYNESKSHEDLLLNKNIRISSMKHPPEIIYKCPKTVSLVLKTIWQTLNLICLFIYHWKPSHIIMQNPPSIPAMSICWSMCLLGKCKFIIDWHNYGYTIMALSMKDQKLVKIYKWYEKFFGKFSHYNFCVSNNMQLDLESKFNIKAQTLYDRPPEKFKYFSLLEKHKFLDQFCELKRELKTFDNLFTQIKDNDPSTAIYKDDRPVLMVNSTSWTPDENCIILLKALKDYDKHAEFIPSLPRIICIITGKGPLKDGFMQIKNNMKWTKVQIISLWLKAEDYPKLLASADIGICLHTSSSGLDLPMKIVDMFGCGLPVCAINYLSICELVKENVTGLIFDNYKSLFDIFLKLFTDFPNSKQLNSLKENVEKHKLSKWESEWNRVAAPIFKEN